MKVIPLGTSSGKPTLKRNVSALAVAREGEWLLFDCGEGTQMQIPRAGLQTSRLAAIFITHLHGDHFNGLAGLLSTMALDRRERELTLVGPPGMREYFHTLERLKIMFVNYPLEVLEFSHRLSPSEAVAAGDLPVVFSAAEYFVSARPIDHRIYTVGYRVEERPRPGKFNLDRARALGIPEGPLFGRLQKGSEVRLDDGRVIAPSEVVGPPRSGKSLAYCTDTRPCRASVDLGSNADLLIHEATYADELEQEASDFGHSTARQAAHVAREAGARRLLITHYSSRYPDATPLLEEARSVFAETIAAQDLDPIDL